MAAPDEVRGQVVRAVVVLRTAASRATSWRASSRSTSRRRPRPTSTRASWSSPRRCRRRRAARSGGPSCASSLNAVPNRLAGETSPYLLQHKDNPVDWYPWGEEALGGRRAEDRPILLSIGYSACHWCHVMERESFEDAETAALMNELFVCIKVDREERPDVDSIYMEACQAMTGHGRLAAQRLPDARAGAVLRRHLLPARSRGWGCRAGATCWWRWPRPGTTGATRSAPAAAASRSGSRAAARLRPSSEPLARGAARRARSRRCGRSTTPPTAASAAAPKFPPASALEFLMRRGERDIVTHTLRAMASGGMYDQVGGGFARYSVDAALARPPLREDALRQRAARARLPARLAADRRAAVPARSPRRRSTGRCARCARRRAASSPRSTPTPRASRASSTSGASPSCARRCSASRRRRRRSRGSGPRAGATSRAPTSRCAAPGVARSPRRLRASASTRCARSASGPASTTSG